jgi:tRNA U34 5-methylaminomethyl-2-thiouridine-forming methyltransferase MnmC
MNCTTPWMPQRTEDGSFTFFSNEFGETFHSKQGAKEEAFQKFAVATNLAEHAQAGLIRLLDVCYGLGYNSAAAVETIWAANPDCQVELYGLELDASVPQAAIAPPIIDSWLPSTQAILSGLAHHHHHATPQLTATLLIGDARQTLPALIQTGFQADAIFVDPFSPRRCPQLWTIEFFRLVVQCLAANGLLATYSRSASVRTAMQAAGLHIGNIPLSKPGLPHEWSQGTVGSLNSQMISPLSQMEHEHLQTRAAVPYRDLTLRDSPAEILQRHAAEQQLSQLESTSSWRRRWGIH